MQKKSQINGTGFGAAVLAIVLWFVFPPAGFALLCLIGLIALLQIVCWILRLPFRLARGTPPKPVNPMAKAMSRSQ